MGCADDLTPHDEKSYLARRLCSNTAAVSAQPGVEVVDGVALTSSGDTVLVLYNDAAPRPLAAPVKRVDAVLASGHSEVLVMQCALGSSTPPDAEIRALCYRDIKRLRPRLRCVVTVPLGDDVWVVLILSVMRGMSTVVGMGSIHFVEKNRADGIARLRSKAAPSEAALHELVATLYAAVGLRSTM